MSRYQNNETEGDDEASNFTFPDETSVTVISSVDEPREMGVDYYKVRDDENSFPEMSIFDPFDADQKKNMKASIFEMLDTANKTGFICPQA